ncbi:MAG: sulfatase-like hydrolase/transferase, partial [Rubripirellula sp.]
MRIRTSSLATALLTGLIAGLACVHAIAQTTAAADRPNIILVFCDDLGYADVGFNAELFGVQTDVVTPNIDALARGGTICKQAYVTHPFCGPSRMGLLSGRMQHCFGGQKNLPDVAKHLEDYNSKGIPESETMISTVLQDAG